MTSPSTVGLPVGDTVVGCCQRHARGAGPLNCANAEVIPSATVTEIANARILDIMPLLWRGRRTPPRRSILPPASTRHATQLSAIHRTSENVLSSRGVENENPYSWLSQGRGGVNFRQKTQ